MRSPLLVFCLLAGATCQRVDEPVAGAPPSAAQRTPSADTARTPPATPTSTLAVGIGSGPVPTSRTTASDAVDAGRCIEPLAEPPAPKAEPASICPTDPEESPPKLRRGKVTVPEAKGSPVIDVEIADTPETEQRGLMYRTKLGREQGMIFVWPREARRTFWMHNTCLPLDMLFLAKDGTIVGLLEQVPVLNDRPREGRCPAAYVLEVNAGWSRSHGVKPGMKLDLSL
jgi:uncharacterized membrane protein (UPF0127 family)